MPETQSFPHLVGSPNADHGPSEPTNGRNTKSARAEGLRDLTKTTNGELRENA
jgi:hypothetical protein